ncbi:hypothetical protein COU60_01105 [Candidatus Pacearchaeota archaeon CG10_big_fil_rev_8_21_14_0_10_34_76]|nr:MAG: hypothetical protein COU60_01105 [Candidatus Pacearchaeota archaeon CG10_big_fil_rev_8_21_14_0_10_34_76]
MNSTGNLLSEVLKIDPSNYTRCVAYYNGRIGEGTAWEYEGGGEKFRIELTPEQAVFLARLTEETYGNNDLSRHPDQWMINSLPEPFVLRQEQEIRLTSACQVALYDFID